MNTNPEEVLRGPYLDMLNKEEIRRSVERIIDGTEIFIVDVTVSADNRVVVEIDSPLALDIDTCARITRAIEADFDRDAEDYELEVGSAGLTAPFKVRGQYLKNIGRTVEILTADSRKLRGILVALEGDDLTLRITRKEKAPGEKRPRMVDIDETIPLSIVKKANLVLEF